MSLPTEQLLILLRDNAWSSIGGLFFPVAVSLYKKFTRQGQSYQEITYRILEGPDKIDVKLWNSGNMTINVSDYQQPLTFYFTGRAVHIRASTVLWKRPRNIDAQFGQPLEPSSSVRILNPFLFRPQEVVALQFKVSGVTRTSLNVRIDGDARDIMEHLKKQLIIFGWSGTGFVLSFLLWLGSTLWYVNHTNAYLFHYASFILSASSFFFAATFIIACLTYATAEKRYQ